jgi:hypothetical protein
MNRRQAVWAIIAVSALGFRGCNTQGPADLLETAGNALARLLEVTNNFDLAQRVRTSVAVTVTLARQWKAGQSAAELLRSINHIIDAITFIPSVEQFRPLITLVLGTLASIMDKIHAAGGQGEDAHTKVRLVKPPQDADEFKKTWDAIRAGSTGMEKAPVL